MPPPSTSTEPSFYFLPIFELPSTLLESIEWESTHTRKQACQHDAHARHQRILDQARSCLRGEWQGLSLVADTSQHGIDGGTRKRPKLHHHVQGSNQDRQPQTQVEPHEYPNRSKVAAFGEPQLECLESSANGTLDRLSVSAVEDGEQPDTLARANKFVLSHAKPLSKDPVSTVEQAEIIDTSQPPKAVQSTDFAAARSKEVGPANKLLCMDCSKWKSKSSVRYPGLAGPKSRCRACHNKAKKKDSSSNTMKPAAVGGQNPGRISKRTLHARGAKNEAIYRNQLLFRHLGVESQSSIYSNATPLKPQRISVKVLDRVFHGSPEDDMRKQSQELINLMGDNVDDFFSETFAWSSKARRSSKIAVLETTHSEEESPVPPKQVGEVRRMVFNTPTISGKARHGKPAERKDPLATVDPNVKRIRSARDAADCGSDAAVLSKPNPLIEDVQNVVEILDHVTSDDKVAGQEDGECVLQGSNAYGEHHFSPINQVNSTGIASLPALSSPSGESRQRTVTFQRHTTNVKPQAACQYQSTQSAFNDAWKGFQSVFTSPEQPAQSPDVPSIAHAVPKEDRIPSTDMTDTSDTQILMPDTQQLFDEFSFWSQTRSVNLSAPTTPYPPTRDRHISPLVSTSPSASGVSADSPPAMPALSPSPFNVPETRHVLVPSFSQNGCGPSTKVVSPVAMAAEHKTKRSDFKRGDVVMLRGDQSQTQNSHSEQTLTGPYTVRSSVAGTGKYKLRDPSGNPLREKIHGSRLEMANLVGQRAAGTPVASLQAAAHSLVPATSNKRADLPPLSTANIPRTPAQGSNPRSIMRNRFQNLLGTAGTSPSIVKSTLPPEQGSRRRGTNEGDLVGEVELEVVVESAARMLRNWEGNAPSSMFTQ